MLVLEKKLDPITKNIFRRQNPLELVFEDISTFDSENPIVGSLLRETDLRKKQTRLDKLRGVGKGTFVNNNQGGPPGGPDLSGLGPSPATPNIEDLIENGPQSPPPPSPPPAFGAPGSEGFLVNLWNNLLSLPTFPGVGLNAGSSSSKPFIVPKIDGDGPIGNNIFGSIGAMMDPKTKREKSKTINEIDGLLYELPDDSQLPHLEMGDGLLDTLGNEGEDIIDDALNRKEEEDLIFEKIIDEYNIPGIKGEIDGTGQVPESIYFFYGGDSDQFVEALEFIGIQGQNR